MVAQPALAKQLIGVVSQQNTLDRQLTVWENLYFHGRLFGIGAAESRRIADELLEQFHLAKWAKASVFALSGGMAQRLMVARAIFHRPAVLFLDEPTAGLDPQSRLALWEILGELNAAGQTILLTTHYMEEADQLCDRVAIMDHGRILALDTPAALKQAVGADTIVTVKARRRLRRAGGGARSGRSTGVTRTRVSTAASSCTSQGPSGSCRGSSPPPSSGGFDVADLSVAEPTPRDRVHQPDRQGAARLMARPPATACRRPAPAGPRPTHRARADALDVAASRTALRRADPARPGGAAEELRRVRRPHADPAVPARVRVPVRVPHDRPGHRRRRRPTLAESAFATVLVPGVVGDLDHVPGHPGGGAAAVHGVRLHARDRGPRAGAVPDLAGGGGQGALRRGPGHDRGA